MSLRRGGRYSKRTLGWYMNNCSAQRQLALFPVPENGLFQLFDCLYGEFCFTHVISFSYDVSLKGYCDLKEARIRTKERQQQNAANIKYADLNGSNL